MAAPAARPASSCRASPRPASASSEDEPLRGWIAVLGGSSLLAAGLGVTWAHPGGLWALALAYPLYELGLAALLTAAAVQGIRALRQAEAGDGPAPSLAVLIAAHNERDFILTTLQSIRDNGWPCEVVIASDGSTDGMNALLVERLDLVAEGAERYRSRAGPVVKLLTLPRVGKGAALNRALEWAQAEVVVTLDADTALGAGALGALARAFRDPTVEAAAGWVQVRNAQANPLTRYQFTEYLKNFVWRIGLARLRVCLQVSGAFGALRTRTLRELGGFAEDSLVEDYEILYRLHDARLRQRRPYRVVVVSRAAAYTEVPDRWSAFVAQRTRWFTGFLQTLWDYRRMIGSRAHGAVGCFMLPIKCVDAGLPLGGLASLLCLGGALLTGRGAWPAWAAALLLARWLLDAALSSALVRWHARAFPERRPLTPPLASQYATALTESLAFSWLRQLAVLPAYPGFARRTRRWEQPRWQRPAPDPASAPGSPRAA
jgi:glycosyltransferase involved in cell wall biosynthesis